MTRPTLGSIVKVDVGHGEEQVTRPTLGRIVKVGNLRVSKT